MDKRLEKYLQTVAHELRGLEAEQREAEIREMRGHLEAIVARLMEGGASEGEAVEAAIAQFGAARRVGRELNRADAGREVWWRIVLAPVCGVVCSGALGFVLSPLYRLASDLIIPVWQYKALTSLLTLSGSLAVGAAAGSLSPKWGGRILLALVVAVNLLGMISMRGTKLEAASYGYIPLALLSQSVGIFLGSRWASRRSRRRTDAQRA